MRGKGLGRKEWEGMGQKDWKEGSSVLLVRERECVCVLVRVCVSVRERGTR